VSNALPDRRPFAIEITGSSSPNSTLLAHARDVHCDAGAFSRSVSQFLRDQKQHFPSAAADEIESLRIDVVGLWWPKRPNDGMIFFAGGKEGRVWRCDYIDRSPKGLGFDS